MRLKRKRIGLSVRGMSRRDKETCCEKNSFSVIKESTGKSGNRIMIKNILEYLETSASKYENKIAFANEACALTFGQVESIAKRIGSALLELNQKNLPIGVYMEKTPYALATYFGVVYAGRCYCPIDAKMPIKRVERILDTLNTNCVVVDQATVNTVKETGFSGEILLYDDLLKSEINISSLQAIRNKMIDTDPLYIIFTSGSTGVPKGVVLSHRSVIDLAEWIGTTFGFNSDTIFGNQTPFYFDASVKDIYSTIRNAAALYIIPQRLFGLTKNLFAFLNEKKINTIMWATSAMCIADSEKAFQTNLPLFLRTIIFAGEAMPVHHLNLWRKYIPNAVYANLYGPTEAAVDASYYIVDRDFEETESLPIGRVCNNMEILILDGDKPVVGNEVGEICIRGTALALGYYGDLKKTNEVFVQNPLQTSYPERIYRTGDMGYYNDRGEIMFASRHDDQIKHHGYRIELGEIESVVSGLEGISRCCCLFNKNEDSILLVYTGQATKKEIVLGIGKHIPKYMWPNAYIQIEKMPMTINGKIDRVKLKAEYIDG